MLLKQVFTTLDAVASKQVVRYSQNHQEKPNQLILDANKNVQYKANFFSKTTREDEDRRNVTDVLVIDSIKDEYHSLLTVDNGLNILG